MSKFNINSPSFTPSVVDKSGASGTGTSGPAPFVPSKSIDLQQIKNKLTISKDKKENVKPTAKLNPAVAGFTPSGSGSPRASPKNVTSKMVTPKMVTAPSFLPAGVGATGATTTAAGAGVNNPPGQFSGFGYYDEMANGAVLAAAQNQQFPLQYHLYAPHYLSASRQRQLLSHQKTARDFFVDPQIHQRLYKQSEDLLRVGVNDDLPKFVDKYHTLFLLDSNLNPSSTDSNKEESPQWVYKCMSSKDGQHYALRRIQGFVLKNEQAMSSVRRWQNIVHPAFVTLHEAFTTRDFGDASLCLVYDFCPSAETLFDLLNRGVKFSHDEIMSYLLQLLSVLEAIHASGLAAKTVDPTKIIVTGPGRVRLNCCGLYDVINYDKDEDVTLFQQQDLRNLGLLVLCLACESVGATKNVEQSLTQVNGELQEIVKYLLSSTTKSASRVLTSLTPVITQALNESFNTNDKLEHELRRELENGRLVRLMAKLNFITERPGPEPDTSQQWSETGDRYLIKLFRDYVFHQQDEMGKPVMDLGHVIRTLNKLDAGVEERITLISRNGQNCLIVSFKDLKVCIENALRDLE